MSVSSAEENKQLVRRLVHEAVARRNPVAHFKCSGTHRGEWLGVSATGRRFEQVNEIYIFTVRDGKLVSAIGVEDNLTRMRQLGIGRLALEAGLKSSDAPRE
jgi:predicted ester cyclase